MCAWSLLVWGFALINREEFYFVVSFNPGQLPSWWERWLYKESLRSEIWRSKKMKTCRQFVNLFLSLFILLFQKKNRWKKLKKSSCPNGEKWHWNFRNLFSWFATVFQVICLYFGIIWSPITFALQGRGLTILEYKQKEKVECFPLVLPSKRLVVVLQDTAKKYIKALATSETRLSHLVCKISAVNPGIKLSGLEMKTLIHTCFYWLKKKKQKKKAVIILMTQCLQNCFFWRRSYFILWTAKA